MAGENFDHEYDLDKLELITPKGCDFQFWVTHRHVEYYQESPYEKFTSSLVANLSKSSDLFIDVGAHFGYYSVLVGGSNPDCQVVAYEPVPENYEVLKRNMELNQLANVEPIQKAVSNQGGKGNFNISGASENCGFNQYPDVPSLKEIEVQKTTLADNLHQYPESSILIKIAVEGHELEVLEGIQGELKKREDIMLVVEFNPESLRAAGHEPERLFRHLYSFGYDIYSLDDEKCVYYRENEYSEEELKAIGSMDQINLLCVPKSRSLNLVFFSHSSELGGAERILLNLVRDLVREKGVLSTVIVRGNGPLKGELEKVGAAVLPGIYGWWCAKTLPGENEIEKILGDGLAWSIEHREKLERIDPDIIISNTLVIPWGAVMAQLTRRPHIWMVDEFGQKDHGFKFFLPFTRVREFIRKASNKVITISEAVREELFGDVEGVKTIYFGRDVPSEEQKDDGIRYYRHAGSTRLLIMGTISDTKGQEDAVLAAADLANNRNRNIELIVVGSSYSHYQKQLESLIRKEGLEDRIHVLPFQENIFPILNQADILLVCSRNEAFGLVTLEGMLMQKAVIGSNSGGTLEMIKDGETGLLYKPGDIQDLANRIEYLIDNPEIRDELGKNAFQFADEKFRREDFVKDYYRTLMAYQNTSSTGSEIVQDFLNRFYEFQFLKVSEAVENNRSDLRSKEKQIQVAESRIHSLENELKTQNEDKRKLMQKSQAFEDTIYELREKLSRRSDKLDDRLEELERLKAELRSINNEKDEISARLDEREKRISNLSQELEQKESALEESHVIIQELKNKLQEKNREITAIEEEINQLAEEKRIREDELDTKEKTLSKLNTRLLEIYDSTAWKIITRLWRARLFLAPHGSLREKFGRNILDFFRKSRYSDQESKDHVHRKRDGDSGKNGQRPISSPSLVSEAGRSTPYKSIYKQQLSTASREKPEEYVEYRDNQLICQDFDVRLLAFYLPQFHPIPENDRWWGKGFTEWTNVSKAVPQFKGHYQPRLPGELGFYDLRIPEVIRRQVNLAKNYGIHGFCFHYYWFDGKRLLEKPMDLFMADDDIDFPFCVCWANENWTRRWDGLDDEILIAQEHSPESDLEFIKDLQEIFSHENYIHVGGRPLLVVYRAELLPQPKETVRRWKDYYRNNGLPEPYLVAAQVFGFRGDPEVYGFDAAVEFPPNTLPIQPMNQAYQPLNSGFDGRFYDYEDLFRNMLDREDPEYTLFKTVMPSWDNTARRLDSPTIFVNATPERYRQWLEEVIRFTRENYPPSRRFAFINAWNEWAEAAYLEPDRKLGYGNLQATADALQNTWTKEKDWKILFVSHDAHLGGAQKSLLSVMRWFKKHTHIDVNILCLAGGRLLPEFEAITKPLMMADLDSLEEEAWKAKLLDYCGGKPDLIYANSAASGKSLFWLSSLDVPILTHVRELQSSIERYAGDWMDDIVKHTDAFIANSDATRQNLVDNYEIKEEETCVAHSFLELSGREILSEEEKAATREKLGLAKDKTLIFGCGIGMPFRKGADLFIDTARKLIDMDEDKFHFYWIGDFSSKEDGTSYDKWDELQKKLENGPLGDKVSFLGKKDDPQEYMQAGDIFLLTSREEPIGRVIMEAAEVGLPGICFADAGGAPEFTGDNAGFVVPYEDTTAMAEMVAYLMHHSQEWADVGRKARQRVLDMFTGDFVMPRVLRFCREVAGQKPGVSVIMTNYDHERYLPERLESIYNQSYRDVEIFLMDDASSDDSAQILQEYEEWADTQVIINQENTGSPFKLWLEAIPRAEAEIIWIAESDDLSEPEFLETLLPAFDDPEVKLAYCASQVMDEDGLVKGNYKDMEYLQSLSSTRWEYPYCIPAEQEVNEALGIKNTILNISAVLFRKPELGQCFWNALRGMHSGGDTYLILNVIKGGKVYYDSQPLNLHRRHRSSIVGKILDEKGDAHLKNFFQDFLTNKMYILENYPLSQDYFLKFEKYMIDLWSTLAPDHKYRDLHYYFPLDKIRQLIQQNIIENQIPTSILAVTQTAVKKELETVLFVSHDAGAAGAQTVLLNITKWFKSHTDIQFKILCLGGGDLYPKFLELADTLVLSNYLDLSGREEKQLAEYILEFICEKPDLVYANSVASGKAFAVLKKLNVPILTHFHELENSIQRYAGKWIDSVIQNSVHFIACSSAVQSNLEEEYDVLPEEISLVHSSIELDDSISIRSMEEKIQLRDDLGLHREKFLVVGCGIGMPYRKGADLFLETAGMLLEKGFEDVHFYWVGEFGVDEDHPEFGPWSDKIADAEQRRGLFDMVTILGRKDNPREYFQACDIFYLPSREDPFPLVALEAAESGLPIICFQGAGGMPDFVEEDAGFVVPFENIEGVVERIQGLIGQPDQRLLLGRKAREKLLQRHTFQQASRRVLAVCRIAARFSDLGEVQGSYHSEKSRRENYSNGELFDVRSFKGKPRIILPERETTYEAKSEKLILKDLNSIYVVIYKTGCTSIKTFFSDYYGWDEVVNVHNIDSEIYEHVINESLLSTKYEDYYKFTFVRNPFSRIFSAFKNKVSPGTESPAFIDGVGKGIYKMGVRSWDSFEDFVNIVCATPDRYCDPHVKPQWRYIVSDSGYLVVDELYKFEDFGREINRLLKKLDLMEEEARFPHKNRTQSNEFEYIKHYNQRIAQKVIDKYKIDFKLFNYEEKLS